MDDFSKDLEPSAKLFLKEAEKRGLTKDALFMSTFDRYIQLLDNLKQLQTALNEYGVYHQNDSGKIVINPIITAFNSTCAGADRAASLLHKIISRTITIYEPDGFDEY